MTSCAERTFTVIGVIFAIISTFFVIEDLAQGKTFDLDVFLHFLELAISLIGFFIKCR